MKVVAVIPAYNEADRISDAVRDALNYVDEAVVVADGSADGSGEIGHAAGAYLLTHVINRGQGAALQTGNDYAVDVLGADYVVHFDSDGQMQGKEIPEFIKALQSGEAEVVLGSRFLGRKAENMPLTRKLTLLASRLFTRIISGVAVTDAHCGFRAYTKNALKKMRFSLDRSAHASEVYDLIAIHKMPYKEIPVTIRYTDDTLAKGSKFSSGFAVLKDLFKQRFFG